MTIVLYTRQWRTEEWVGGRTLPLACDLRNKRDRMRQNMVFSTKKYERVSGERTQPPAQTLPPVGRGISPPQTHHSRCLRHLDPSRSKILGTPLTPEAIFYRRFSVSESVSPDVFEIMGQRHIGVMTLTFQGHVTSQKLVTQTRFTQTKL